MSDAVLAKFEVSEKDLIGHGGESNVYALPDQKMLRVYKKGATDKIEFLRMLKVFYDGISGKFSLKTPRILELAIEDGTLYSINERIEGRGMHHVLPQLNADDKRRLFQNYFDALEEIPSVAFPERPYGEIFGAEPVVADTWTDFLEKTIRRQARYNEQYLGRDIEQFPALVDTIVREARAQDPHPTKTLVHGDFFPNNVLVGDDLAITGVIDMSGLTVVGDHIADVASSYIFLETTEGATAEDSEIYWSILTRTYGEGVQKTFDFYKLYYCIYLGIDDGPEAAAYPGFYEWTVATLKKFQSRLNAA